MNYYWTTYWSLSPVRVNPSLLLRRQKCQDQRWMIFHILRCIYLWFQSVLHVIKLHGGSEPWLPSGEMIPWAASELTLTIYQKNEGRRAFLITFKWTHQNSIYNLQSCIFKLSSINKKKIAANEELENLRKSKKSKKSCFFAEILSQNSNLLTFNRDALQSF